MLKALLKRFGWKEPEPAGRPRSLSAAADPFVYDGDVPKKTIDQMNSFAEKERKDGRWMTVTREAC